MKEDQCYTVITGASMGLGKCMAIECASRGRNIILVALAGESVTETAKEIADQFGVKTASYETDLTSLDNIKSLVSWIKTSYKVDMLINNAGIGGTNYFQKATTKYIDIIIHLNMAALVHLTHQLLPLLKAEKKSFILNIASFAAFGPMPYKTIYPASKAFVSSFSRGLNTELKETSVSVSVAYPGGMATNPEITERMSKHKGLLKASFLAPQKIAEICIRKTLAGKKVIVPGAVNKFNRLLIKLIPVKIMLGMASKTLKKELEEKPS